MKKILALLDFSDAMPEVIQAAGEMARAFEATVYLVHVIDPDSDCDDGELRKDVSREGMAHELRRKRRMLQLAAVGLKRLGTETVARLVRGSPLKRALHELSRRNPDLVVVGKHGHGRLHYLFRRSIGIAVARKAQLPGFGRSSRERTRRACRSAPVRCRDLVVDSRMSLTLDGMSEEPATTLSSPVKSSAPSGVARRSPRRTHFFRAAVIGLCAGLLAVAFRRVLALAETARGRVLDHLHGHPMWGWAVLPAIGLLAGAVVGWMTTRIAPEAAGSGIPHLKGVLLHVRRLRWRRLIPVKFIGGVVGIGAGLSLGREGPTVQMGAAVAQALGGLLRTPEGDLPQLFSAGAGAGLAAAFNAPLAGLLFVIEELHRELSSRTAAGALRRRRLCHRDDPVARRRYALVRGPRAGGDAPVGAAAGAGRGPARRCGGRAVQQNPAGVAAPRTSLQTHPALDPAGLRRVCRRPDRVVAARRAGRRAVHGRASAQRNADRRPGRARRPVRREIPAHRDQLWLGSARRDLRPDAAARRDRRCDFRQGHRRSCPPMRTRRRCCRSWGWSRFLSARFAPRSPESC